MQFEEIALSSEGHFSLILLTFYRRDHLIEKRSNRLISYLDGHYLQPYLRLILGNTNREYTDLTAIKERSEKHVITLGLCQAQTHTNQLLEISDSIVKESKISVICLYLLVSGFENRSKTSSCKIGFN